MAAQLKHRWASVTNGTLVLIEGPWDIEHVGDGLVLGLAGLTVDEDEASREQTVDMPATLAVTTKVSTAMLLAHRAGRLQAGQRMTLGVFGQVSRRKADDDGALSVEPTAVFERLAAPR